MKKLFVSVPMNGRTEENIRKSIDKMHSLAEIIFNEKLEVLPSYFQSEWPMPPMCNERIYLLGKSLVQLSIADFFIGVNYSDCFKGCNIEREVAYAYGIKSYCVDYSIFPDAVEAEREHARKMWETGGCI